MVAYQHFVALCNSSDSGQRGEAAHMVATAFVEHDGPADEHAALYASLLGFLDDPSIKVRASLAYGLLHSELAPRIIMLSLIKDAPIISRAVVQYSPVLLDVDLIGVVGEANSRVLTAIVERENLSEKLMLALLNRGDIKSIVRLLGRENVSIPVEFLCTITSDYGDNARIRGKLLVRSDLPAICRLQLVEQVKLALNASRLVKGAIAPERLEKLMRDAVDCATTRIGEEQSIAEDGEYARQMHRDDLINTRVLLHSVINGQVLFFADCIALLCQMPTKKVFTLLGQGARVALNALFSECGMSPALRNLMARLVLHARNSDLSNDDAARHFVVTALIEELIIEHEGDIPDELEEVFRYLDEQNMYLARKAARGVMPAFAEHLEPGQLLLEDTIEHTPGQVDPGSFPHSEEQLALPAA